MPSIPIVAASASSPTSSLSSSSAPHVVERCAMLSYRDDGFYRHAVLLSHQHSLWHGHSPPCCLYIAGRATASWNGSVVPAVSLPLNRVAMCLLLGTSPLFPRPSLGPCARILLRMLGTQSPLARFHSFDVCAYGPSGSHEEQHCAQDIVNHRSRVKADNFGRTSRTSVVLPAALERLIDGSLIKLPGNCRNAARHVPRTCTARVLSSYIAFVHSLFVATRHRFSPKWCSHCIVPSCVRRWSLGAKMHAAHFSFTVALLGA